MPRFILALSISINFCPSHVFSHFDHSNYTRVFCIPTDSYDKPSGFERTVDSVQFCPSGKNRPGRTVLSTEGS